MENREALDQLKKMAEELRSLMHANIEAAKLLVANPFSKGVVNNRINDKNKNEGLKVDM